MGLITKEVDVYLNGRNIQRYEKLGYTIPRRYDKLGRYKVPINTTIAVKIEDLSKGSHYTVDVECDGVCGKILHPKYQDYYLHSHDGKYYCQNCYIKLFQSGENASNWNPNLTDEEREIGRNYPEYKEFVRTVLARDHYTCQCCGRKNKLEVHHIDGYNWCKERRTDETNGITLCEDCHSNFHSIFGYGNNTKEQFEEWNKIIRLEIAEPIKYENKILPTRKIYCIETDIVYDGAKDVCKKLKINNATGIYNVCNKKKNYKSANGYHFLWHDDYLSMSQKDIDNFMDYCNDNNNHKKVICLETEEVFDAVTYAANKYATSEVSGTSNIARACRKVGLTSYCREDGLQLHWMYYDDYLTKTSEQIYEIKHTFFETRPIVCLSYNIVYKSASEASRNCGVKISDTSISSACKREFGQTGKLPNKHKLTWMYYDLFVELSTEEQEKLLCQYKEDFPCADFLLKKGA